MVEAAASGGVPRASRLDRRKARTRQALIDAAVRLIAEGRGERASIAEITEACLRLLGVAASEAARLVASCLPPVGAVSR